MPRDPKEEKKKEQQPVQVVEVPITLELINNKLNHLIALAEQKKVE